VKLNCPNDKENYVLRYDQLREQRLSVCKKTFDPYAPSTVASSFLYSEELHSLRRVRYRGA